MPEEKPRFGCRQCLNVGEGLKPSPTGREQKAGHGDSTHKPQAILSPTPRTTYCAPRTHTTDTRVRLYNEIKQRATSHEPKQQATSHVQNTTLQFPNLSPTHSFGPHLLSCPYAPLAAGIPSASAGASGYGGRAQAGVGAGSSSVQWFSLAGVYPCLLYTSPSPRD